MQKSLEKYLAPGKSSVNASYCHYYYFSKDFPPNSNTVNMKYHHLG